MAIEVSEIVFYAIVFGVGTFAGLCRLLRDGGSGIWHRDMGVCMSGGVFAYGVIGFWVSDSASSSDYAGYFAGAAFIGWFGPEVADFGKRSIKGILKFLLERIGIKVEVEEPKDKSGE